MSFKYSISTESNAKQLPEGWVGFDLDGTVAEYTEFKGWQHIGNPISAMVNLIKKLRAVGIQCKIFTARCSAESRAVDGLTFEQVEKVIQDWTEQYIGERLPVTSEKGCSMICFFDDSAVQVNKNMGTLTAGEKGFAPFVDRLIKAIKDKGIAKISQGE
jgi:hypothetical protein